LVTARSIVSSSRDHSREEGECIVSTLLFGRVIDDLSHEELLILAQGYNWWGKHDEAYSACKRAFRQRPKDSELMVFAKSYFENYLIANHHEDHSLYLPIFLEACEIWEVEGFGTVAFWAIWKAEVYSLYGTGEIEEEGYEWNFGDPISNPEMLDLAAQEIEKALRSDPLLFYSTKDKVGIHNWNEKFAAVLSIPKFQHLMDDS
jgi:tetratricopeptide (TPR) repeat protein